MPKPRNIYVHQDTKIGNLAPILNPKLFGDSGLSRDRLDIPKGQSGDWHEAYVNRAFQMEQEPTEYLTGMLGHLSRPYQAFIPSVEQKDMKHIMSGRMTHNDYNRLKMKYDRIHGAGFFDKLLDGAKIFAKGFSAPFRVASQINPIFGFGVSQAADKLGVPKLGVLGAGLHMKQHHDGGYPFNNVIDPPVIHQKKLNIKIKDSNSIIKNQALMDATKEKKVYVLNPRTI